MNTFVWLLQVVFGILFVGHGLMLSAKPASRRTQLETIPYGSGFLTFIGVWEVLGGFGLLLPMWTGIAPWLTPLAAAGLAIIMAGAVWTHVSAKQTPQSGVTALITLLLIMIVALRWSLFSVLA